MSGYSIIFIFPRRLRVFWARPIDNLTSAFTSRLLYCCYCLYLYRQSWIPSAWIPLFCRKMKVFWNCWHNPLRTNLFPSNEMSTERFVYAMPRNIRDILTSVLLTFSAESHVPCRISNTGTRILASLKSLLFSE